MNDRAASSGGSGAPKPDASADRDATGKSPPDKPRLPARFTDEDLVDITPKKKLPARLSDADLAGVRDEPRTRLRGPIEVAGVSATRPAPLADAATEPARPAAAARPAPRGDSFEPAPGAPRKPAGAQSFEAADVQGMRDEIHHRRLSKLSLDNIFSRGARREGPTPDAGADDPQDKARDGHRAASAPPDVIDVQAREIPDPKAAPRPGRSPAGQATAHAPAPAPAPAPATARPASGQGAAGGVAKSAAADTSAIDANARRAAPQRTAPPAAAPASATGAATASTSASAAASATGPAIGAATAAPSRAGAQRDPRRAGEPARPHASKPRREAAPDASTLAGSIRPPAWLIRECVLALLGAAGVTFLVAEAYGLYGHWGVVPLWLLIVGVLHRWSRALQRRGSLRMAMVAAVATNLASVALVGTLERAIGWTGGAAPARDVRAAATPLSTAGPGPAIDWPALAATAVFGFVAWLNFRRLARPVMLVPLLLALWVVLMQAGVWVMSAHSLRTVYLAQVSAAFGLTTVIAGEWLRRRILQRNSLQTATPGGAHTLPDFSSWPQHLGIVAAWLGLWALWPRTVLGHGALGLANVAFALAYRHVPRRLLIVLGTLGAAIHLGFAAMLLQHPDWSWLAVDPLEWLEPWASLLVR